ncbi:MAG: DoxX family protein [Flavobacteriaceae bacterium]
MTVLQHVSLYSMSAIFVIAGLCHFLSPKFYIKITPKWVPCPKYVNIFVGGVEIILGVLLLLAATRLYAVIGIITLLIAVFPANVLHYNKAKRKEKYVLLTLLRLPIQGVLIYWAYTLL